jgi:uncharacterized protein
MRCLLVPNRLCRSLVAGLLLMSAAACAAEKKPQDMKLAPEPVALIEKALPAKATATPKKARRILVFWKCEGFFHREGIIAGNKCLELMGPKLGVWQADITDDFAVFTAANLAQYDALVFNNSTNLKSLAADPAKIAAVTAFVRGGKALVGIHAATDNGGCRELAKLLGGQFAGHPWGGGGTWAFKLEEPQHVLLAGFQGRGFQLRDEIYQFQDYYTRDDRRVLITLDLSDPATAAQKGGREDQDYAVSWIKTEGQGRIFYCSLGHNGSVFLDRAVVQHYLDGIQWAMGDLEADATPKK